MTSAGASAAYSTALEGLLAYLREVGGTATYTQIAAGMYGQALFPSTIARVLAEAKAADLVRQASAGVYELTDAGRAELG